MGLVSTGAGVVDFLVLVRVAIAGLSEGLRLVGGAVPPVVIILLDRGPRGGGLGTVHELVSCHS